jgi:hypothetical protein
MQCNACGVILAHVTITDANAAGALFAHGSRFGGHALFIKDRKLHYVYNFLGIKPEQHFVSSGELTPGKQILGVEFIREGEGPPKENIGRVKLYVNDKVVAEGPARTQLGKFTLAGDGLCVGYDSGDAVSHEYAAPATFEGGKISLVEVAVDNVQYSTARSSSIARCATDGATQSESHGSWISDTKLVPEVPSPANCCPYLLTIPAALTVSWNVPLNTGGVGTKSLIVWFRAL